MHGTVGSIMRRSIDRSIDPARIERVCTLVEPQTNVMERERATILHLLPSSLSIRVVAKDAGIQSVDTDDAFDGTKNNGKIRRKIRIIPARSRLERKIRCTKRERERDRLPPVSKVHAVEAVESTFIGCKFTGAITGRYNAGY